MFRQALPRAAPPGFSDHTFKSSAGSELSVRVWPANPPVAAPAPFVSWTHGGGWFGGNHYTPLAWMEPGFRQRGYHLVSHNYRLAPQANLDDQLADCLDAIAWCRTNLPSILGADKVDVDRYIICGESAGGLLVGLMGHHLSPPPRAVIDVYGIIDPLSAFPLLLHNIPNTGIPWVGEFSDKELDDFLVDRKPSNQLTDALYWDENLKYSERTISKQWGIEFRNTRRIRLQGELHRWRSDQLTRMGSTIKSFLKGSVHDERFADKEAVKAYLVSISPYNMLEGKTSYPPTAFLHGTADQAAVITQSIYMAYRLKCMGVPVVECYEPFQPHVFDDKYTSPAVPGWALYIQPILDFCNYHVSFKPEQVPYRAS